MVLSIIFLAILVLVGIYVFQDRTKKLEDRRYKDIDKLIINSDVSDINFYKSEDENIRVVIYGLTTDNVELVEGSKELSIDKHGKKGYCLINCRNKIDIYLPSEYNSINITTEVGSINVEEIKVNSLTFNSDSGNVKLGSTNTVNITTNSGNVDIKEIIGTASSSIKTDSGNITIDKISNLKVESNVELGSNEVSTIDGEFTLKLETNAESINIKEYENKSE